LISEDLGPAMAETTEEIVYGEAIRAITEQQGVLDGLRSRTGILLAAASIVTSFLGGEALREESAIHGLEWFGLGSFAAVTVLSMVILVPWRGWKFAMSAKVLIEDHVDVEERNSPRDLSRFLAERLDEYHDKNASKLAWMHGAYALATLALGAEVIAWLIELGRG
jgi:hypothetical protein